ATVVAWLRGGTWLRVGFLGAAVFLMLAPSSSVVPIVTEIAAERRIYLALAPLLVLAILALEWLVERFGQRSLDRRPQWIQWTAAAIVVVLLAVTFARSTTYASTEA